MEAYTVEEAKTWYEEHKEAVIESSGDYKDLLRSSGKMAQAYVAGEWLWEKLREMGADEDVGRNTCFALGQRAFFGDPFPTAVQYANEYAENHAIHDKPGETLARQIMDEL